MLTKINIPDQVHTADVLFASHSGGKDSQAMLSVLVKQGFQGRIVLIHADLGEMEWESMHHWIASISHGIEVHVVKSEMDFFEMVRKYNRIPSGHQQFCTDFLKTKPIEKFIHDYMTNHGFKTAINVTGMRAQESKRRAKKEPFALSEMTRPKLHPTHKIFDWLPIFDFSELEVFAEIASCGQEPHHIYSLGFSRLSCVFCVNGRIGEHRQAAELRPELALKIANLEREVGKTYRLRQVKNVKYPHFFDQYLSVIPPMFSGALA